MPIWATVSPTAVSTAHTPPLAVTTTLESVTPRPSPMPIWATVSPTAVSTAHTPPLVVTTTLESVMLRPSPMAIWATVSPTEVSTAHTPPLEATTTLESVMLRPSLMPIWATVSPTAVSTAHTPPLEVTTTLESVTLRPSPMPGAITGLEDLSPPMEASTASWLTPTDISWLTKKIRPTEIHPEGTRLRHIRLFYGNTQLSPLGHICNHMCGLCHRGAEKY